MRTFRNIEKFCNYHWKSLSFWKILQFLVKLFESSGKFYNYFDFFLTFWKNAVMFKKFLRFWKRCEIFEIEIILSIKVFHVNFTLFHKFFYLVPTIETQFSQIF